jgi:enhancing lycopene biosynthesis protein 2
MRRTKKLLVVTATAVTMLVAAVLPAVAQSQEVDSIIFLPYGNGATYSCTGGAPFIFDPHSGEGNCAVEQIGKPAGLVCEVPTTVRIVHGTHQAEEDAKLCQ